jgi:hypothetical protein
MADKPHFSTLLMKQPASAAELQDEDQFYLLKAGGGASRDRRLSLGNLIKKILGGWGSGENDNGVRIGGSNGLDIKNRFIWENTSTEVLQFIRSLYSNPLVVQNEYLSGVNKIQQLFALGFSRFMYILNKWQTDPELYTSVDFDAHSLHIINKWAGWMENFGDWRLSQKIWSQNSLYASNPFTIENAIMESTYELTCSMLKMVNQWEANQKEVYKFGSDRIYLTHNGSIYDTPTYPDSEHTVFGIRPGTFLVPRAGERTSPPQHAMAFGKTGDDLKNALVFYADIFDGTDTKWLPNVGIGQGRGKFSAGGVFNFGNDVVPSWGLGCDANAGGSTLELRLRDTVKKVGTPTGGVAITQSRAGMYVNPGIINSISKPISIYTERVDSTGDAIHRTNIEPNSITVGVSTKGYKNVNITESGISYTDASGVTKQKTWEQILA